MPVTLDDAARRLLDGRHFAVVAAAGPGGQAPSPRMTSSRVLRSETNSREGSCRSSAAFLPGLWSPAPLGSALIRRTSTYSVWRRGRPVQCSGHYLPWRRGRGQMSAIPAPDDRAPGYTGAIPRTTEGGRLGLALVVIASAQLMVVLDATIVNVALPHIQRSLGFSGSGLEWVVNAYAVTFGGLLLLGGRAGDRLGRRRVLVAGLLLFSGASLFGGFAIGQWWLLAARAVQGAGGAVIAPTALALITTNFPEGGPRNRAMGVYSAMAGGGGAVGLALGGLLTTYVSWRWVLFVNVPIGILVAAVAPRVLAESPRRPGPVDVAGAVTGTAGLALLVYGLSEAATGPDGVSHWGDALVLT